MRRTCIVCQGPLPVDARANRRYCSDECRIIARQYRDAHRAPDVANDTWGCVACGAPLADKQRSTKRFCSAACRSAFWRAMKPHREAASVSVLEP